MVCDTAIRTMWFVADSTSQHLLALCGFPEAVDVQVDAGATGDVRGPAAKYGVTVVRPAVVDPVLHTQIFQEVPGGGLRVGAKAGPSPAALTSSLKRPIHMGLRALLTYTVRVACRKVSATLARSMLFFLHCSKASNQVRFLSSSRMVWLLTVKLSFGTWGSTGLSGTSKPRVLRAFHERSIDLGTFCLLFDRHRRWRG